MNKFEELEREIIDICKDNNVEFMWSTDHMVGYYLLKFKKSGKGFNINISERDFCIKPLALIKVEVENAIFTLLEETK
jgi:hypothetical protein